MQPTTLLHIATLYTETTETSHTKYIGKRATGARLGYDITSACVKLQTNRETYRSWKPGFIAKTMREEASNRFTGVMDCGLKLLQNTFELEGFEKHWYSGTVK